MDALRTMKGSRCMTRVNPERFRAVYEKSSTGYAAHVPNLPGCIATGRTLAKCQQQVREAVQFHLEGMRQDRLPIPRPLPARKSVRWS
jgi:predicted RNase H-like HicB family nuclease